MGYTQERRQVREEKAAVAVIGRQHRVNANQVSSGQAVWGRTTGPGADDFARVIVMIAEVVSGGQAPTKFYARVLWWNSAEPESAPTTSGTFWSASADDLAAEWHKHLGTLPV